MEQVSCMLPSLCRTCGYKIAQSAYSFDMELRKKNQQTTTNALFLASLVVAALAVDEKHSEVDNIEVGDGCVEASGQRPGQTHEEITTARCVSKVSFINIDSAGTYK
jgi:hypothetical protein